MTIELNSSSDEGVDDVKEEHGLVYRPTHLPPTDVYKHYPSAFPYATGAHAHDAYGAAAYGAASYLNAGYFGFQYPHRGYPFAGEQAPSDAYREVGAADAGRYHKSPAYQYHGEMSCWTPNSNQASEPCNAGSVLNVFGAAAAAAAAAAATAAADRFIFRCCRSPLSHDISVLTLRQLSIRSQLMRNV